MPLPKPVLDNRSFDQLVAEGRGLIPRLAPTWTDHNTSDPGITLMELAAWLTEQNLYRMDRVPDEALRAFLRLVGVTPRPPQVARTVLVVGNQGAAPVTLPARLQVTDTAGGLFFETIETLTVSPAQLVQVLAGRGTLTDYTLANSRPHNFGFPDEGSFPVLGSRPRPGAALYLDFDRALGNAGDTISLHLWTTTPEADARMRVALIAEWQAEQDRIVGSCPKGSLALLPDWRQHYRARTVWEYHRGGGAWVPLPEVEDETRALTLSGFVRFRLPPDHVAGGPEPHFFVRCRLISGRYECPPRLDRVAVNAVPVEHARSIDGEKLGSSHGHAAERYQVKYPPVIASSTQVTLVQGATQDGDWHEVPNWDRVGAHDRAYRLDPTAGVIDFGDGRRGWVPPAGYDVFVSYRSGGGASGNAPAGTLVRWDGGAHNQALMPDFPTLAANLPLTQPQAAFSGEPAQTLQSAQAQAVEMLSSAQKVITLEDFEVLARRTPGVPIGRAKALAGYHPALPCYTAHGVVSVVVVPDCPGRAPLPSRAMLNAVARYLRWRRLVTTEVHVIAPHYVSVAVHATVHTHQEADPKALLVAAEQRLAEFFHPLRGGPDGGGWPIGRYVYRTEIFELLSTLPGVTRVTGLGLRARGDAEPRCGNVEICPNDLVAPGRHRIEILPTGGVERLYRSVEHECP
jgi:hypothetical protein